MSALALFLLQIAVIVLVTGLCGVLLLLVGMPETRPEESAEAAAALAE